jgi:hypothetical protein
MVETLAYPRGRPPLGCASGSAPCWPTTARALPTYVRLAADPGRVGLESLPAEIAKLEQLRAMALPSDLLRGLPPDQAKRFRRRAAGTSVIRRSGINDRAATLTLVGACCTQPRAR